MKVVTVAYICGICKIFKGVDTPIDGKLKVPFPGEGHRAIETCEACYEPCLTNVQKFILATGNEMTGLEGLFLERGMNVPRGVEDQAGSGTDQAGDVDPEPELCRRDGCEEPLDDNEGYDGLCGSCADHAENTDGEPEDEGQDDEPEEPDQLTEAEVRAELASIPQIPRPGSARHATSVGEFRYPYSAYKHSNLLAEHKPRVRSWAIKNGLLRPDQTQGPISSGVVEQYCTAFPDALDPTKVSGQYPGF
ncbi:hypothetical protein ACFWY5_29785 [Nonomuraea sp. NPDC059007]|uniref:hypothetical protein n=1 Tax=Nonomuraea sp. NPDC059007 TaxID=3346692 RepID=UPI0036C6BB15